MIAKPLPIGVVQNPISAGEPRFDCPLQSSKSLVFLAKHRENTAGVVENCVIIRRKRYRAVIPFSGTLDFSKPRQNYGAQIESARLIGVELQVFVYRFDRELIGALSFIGPVQSPQHLTDQRRRLIILRSDGLRFLEELKRPPEISSFEARSRIVVISVEQRGIELDGSLELGSRLAILLLHRETLARGNMRVCQLGIEL